MRPLRLEVEGFTCYRDRQPVLEFSELTLFAIAGPTGAGKSSVLDAMLYALFGEVPRIGKQGVAEFISQGRDRMSVALDFRVRNRDYRVTRASKRLKSSVKTDATLAELTAAGERSIASQVKPVNDEIVQLLGLGYDEFIQTVVLPQGEFAKFLRSKPAEQRSILQHLLRHDVFTRMRDLAEDRRREMDADLRGLDGKLSALADATDEVLATCEQALTTAREHQAAAATARDKADREAEDARTCRKLTQDVEQLRSQWLLLDQQNAVIDNLRVELDQARRATGIIPRLEAFRAATARVETAREAYAKAGDAAESAAAAKKESADRAAAASTAAKECAALSTRLLKLHEIAGDVTRRAQLVAALEAAASHVSSAESSLKDARNAEARTRRALQDLVARLQDLQAAVNESEVDVDLLEAIEESFPSVGEAKAVQQHIEVLEAELKRCEREQIDAERKAADALIERDKAYGELQRAKAGLAKEELRVQELTAALGEAQVDVVLLEALENSIHSVATARTIQQDIASLEAEREHSENERSDAARRTAVATAESDKAQADLRAAEEALAIARIEVEAGRERDRAVSLRAHLHIGDACPVCLQTVPEVPAAVEALALAALEGELANAESRAALAATTSRNAQAASAGARAALTQAERVVGAISVKLADRRAALNELLSTLLAVVPGGSIVDGSTVLVWMEERREILRAASTERARREGDLRAAEGALNLARLAVAEAEGVTNRTADLYQRHLEDQARIKSAAIVADTRLAERRIALDALFSALLSIVPVGTQVDAAAIVTWIEERRDGLRAAKSERERRMRGVQDAEGAVSAARLAAAEAEGVTARALDHHQRQVEERARLQAELEATVTRILSVSAHPDPVAEREELARRIDDLQDAERQAGKALVEATNAAIQADAELHAKRTGLSEATTYVTETGESLTEALADAGFATLDAAVASVRSDAQQTALQSSITAFEEKRSGVQQRLAELEPLVTGNEMSSDRLDEIERRAKTAAETSRQADQGVAKLETELARLCHDVRARGALIVERSALHKAFAVTAELAADLKGDRFQEYLLEEAFKTLVAGASVRLKTISNRYTLQWESGEFYVVDHDNAGERRRAETLSGGETFMASLCLALQLSDEVLRTSGALQMDSLFIDEGFGTLDSDSLSEVTDAMEALQQDGDRMIGVISHRPELTDRLPGCIRVNKGVGESQWILERVG